MIPAISSRTISTTNTSTNTAHIRGRHRRLYLGLLTVVSVNVTWYRCAQRANYADSIAAASAGYQQSYEQQPTLPTLNLPPPDAYMDSHNSYTSNRPSRSSSYPTGPGVYPSSAYSGNYSPVSYHNTTTTSSMQRRPINETTSYYDTTPSQWPLDHFGSMEPEESKPFPSSSSSASSSSSYHPYRNHPPLRALSPPPPIVPTSSSAPPPPPQAPPGPKSCAHCHTTTTPMWRREPQTARPLCNACGLYMQQRNMRRPQELIDADGPSPSSHSPSSDPSSASSSSALPYDGPECSHCHTHITSVWRRNKAGDQVCNACGVYLRLKGKERPLDLAQKRNKIKPRLSKKDTWAASSSS